MAKKTTEKKKKEIKKAVCHECIESFSYKELYSIEKISESFVYTVVMCKSCCDEKKVTGILYSDLLKERRKHTSDITNDEDKS